MDFELPVTCSLNLSSLGTDLTSRGKAGVEVVCFFFFHLENETLEVGSLWGPLQASFISIMKHIIHNDHLDIILCKSLFNPPAFLF